MQQGYTDRVKELNAEIKEDEAQKYIERLEDSGTFFAGLEAAGLQLAENSTSWFDVGQEAFESFTNNATNSLLEFTDTGKVNFKGFATSVINRNRK